MEANKTISTTTTSTVAAGQIYIEAFFAILLLLALMVAIYSFPILLKNDREIASKEVSKVATFVVKSYMEEAVKKSYIYTTENAPYIMKKSTLDVSGEAQFFAEASLFGDAFLFASDKPSTSSVYHELFHKIDRDSGYNLSSNVDTAVTKCKSLFENKKAIINDEGIIKFIDGKEFVSKNFSDAENKRYFSCWTLTKAYSDVEKDTYYKTLSKEEKQAEVAAISYAEFATKQDDKLLDAGVINKAFPNMFLLKETK